MRSLVRSTLLVLTLFSAGCGADTSCFDCGSCGIAGPTANPGHQIDALEPGVTDGGVAAVDLGLEDGECIGGDRKMFRVAYDAGAVSVSPGEALAKLDTTKVTFPNDTATWSDRDLTMTFTYSGTTLVLAFTAPGKSVKVACKGADHAITCAMM